MCITETLSVGKLTFFFLQQLRVTLGNLYSMTLCVSLKAEMVFRLLDSDDGLIFVYLVYKLLHFLHGMVSLQRQRDHPQVILLIVVLILLIFLTRVSCCTLSM